MHLKKIFCCFCLVLLSTSSYALTQDFEIDKFTVEENQGVTVKSKVNFLKGDIEVTTGTGFEIKKYGNGGEAHMIVANPDTDGQCFFTFVEVMGQEPNLVHHRCLGTFKNAEIEKTTDHEWKISVTSR